MGLYLRNKFVLLILFLLVGSHTFADSLEDAVRLSKVGKSAEAQEILKKLTDEGDMEASYLLGLLLWDAKNPDLAKDSIKYLKYAADNRGPVEAAYMAAVGLIEGIGVSQDIETGSFYLRMAAERGHFESAEALGELYRRHAELVPYEEVRAALSLADRLGSARSSYHLGFLLSAEGEDVEAHAAWIRAANAGSSDAKYVVAYNLMAGRGAATNNQKAFRWAAEAADEGVIEASLYAYVLASKYKPSIARKYLKISLDHEMPEAFWFGYLDFSKGATGKVDVNQALSFLEKAALLGVNSAMLSLSNRYKTGDGVQKDLNMARHWLSLVEEDTLPFKRSMIRALDDEIAVMKKIDNYDFTKRKPISERLLKIARSFRSSKLRSSASTYATDGNHSKPFNVGTSGHQWGDTFFSNRGVYTRIGSTIFGPDGIHHEVGGATLGPSGARYGSDLMYGVGSPTCLSIGESVLCN